MKRFNIKGKLLFFFSSLIAVIILVQFSVSYIGLEKAYQTTQVTAEEKFDSTIKTSVENLISVLSINYQRYQSGEITEQEAMEIAKKIVRDTRYGENSDGYFWADDKAGNCVVHMNPEYEGKARYDAQDLNGVYYIRNIIASGDKDGGGYTEFYFTKPNEDGSFRKKAFTQKFEPYGWYISTGIYYDDVEKLTAQYKTDERNHLAVLLLFSLLALTFGIIIVRILANKITKPLNKVTERLVLLSEGDFHTPVPEINTHDETRVLADAAKNTVDELSAVIKDISSHLAELSSGDFTASITHHYKGDMMPIKASLLQIIGSLNGTLTQIDQSADLVSGSSNQVSIAAQSLAQGATEQASAIDVLSGTISEISGKARDTADNAAEASRKASHVNSVIAVGEQQIGELIGAMNNISDSSEQIRNIIKTIDDISFQTNLLALNAAVEAARAGEAGKGFAVVADEVGNLASRSAEAAKNTTALIENALKAVADGSKIVNSTTETLEKVVENTKDITREIEKISEASVQQSQSIESATEGVMQISTVIQTNSATAQESAAASEELSEQARMLKELVGRFKLNTASQNGSVSL